MVPPLANAISETVDPNHEGALLIDTLLEVASALAAPQPLTENLTKVLEAVITALKLDRGSLYAPNDDGSIELVAEVGPASVSHPASSFVPPGTTPYRAFHERRLVVDNDHTPGRLTGRVVAAGSGLRSIAAFPVEHMGERLGVLHFGSLMPAFFTESRITFLFAVARDCAALVYNAKLREATEAQLRLANDRSEFIAIASHELRTPISVISGFAELLIDSDRYSGVELECLTSVMAQAIRLSKTVDDLVNLEWMRSGDQMGHGTPFRISELLQDVRELVVGNWPNATFRIVWDTDDEIVGDLTRLKAVLASVVDNAYRHGGATAVVLEASTDPTQGLCRLLVRDNGCGFPEGFTTDDIALFQRPSYETTSNKVGIGLGLFVVKTFVESVGGTLSLASDQDGTVVEMQFPNVMTTD